MPDTMNLHLNHAHSDKIGLSTSLVANFVNTTSSVETDLCKMLKLYLDIKHLHLIG